MALLEVAGTVRLPNQVPVAPLQQLNLKVPPAVLDHWRAQAAAQGLSVRDWLVSIACPTAAPGPGRAGGDGLADRVAQLEAGRIGSPSAALGDRGFPPRCLRLLPAAIGYPCAAG